jgi:hypothetical protein
MANGRAGILKELQIINKERLHTSNLSVADNFSVVTFLIT